MSVPDLSEFEALAAPRKRVVCALAAPLAGLPDGERSQLEAAIRAGNEVIGSGAISKWLARREYKASTNQVTAHRRGQCSCHE